MKARLLWRKPVHPPSARRFGLGIGLGLLLAAVAPATRAEDSNYFVFDDLSFEEQTIDFDKTWDGKTLTAPKLFEEAEPLRDQYAELGIRFGGAQGGGGGAILHQESNFGTNARSGTNFLAFNREASAQGGETPREPLVLIFDYPVPAVSVYAAGGFVAETFRMEGYDRAGRLVALASITTKAFQKLSVAATGGMTRVVVSREVPLRTTVTLPAVTAPRGGEVAIPVQIGPVAQVAAAQVAVKLESVASVESGGKVAAGSLLRDAVVQAKLDVPGTVEASGASGTGANGPGTALVLTAKIKADAAPGTYPLKLLSAQLGTVTGQPIQVDLVDGTLTVVAGACGDFDAGGTLTVSDAVIGLRISVGLQAATAAQTQAACGHPIDVSLVVRILRAAVGLTGPIAPAGG